jgi:hypothetical protein
MELITQLKGFLTTFRRHAEKEIGICLSYFSRVLLRRISELMNDAMNSVAARINADVIVA